MPTFKDRRAGWQESERYQQLVEMAPDGILIHDGERVVLANTAAVKLAGATDMAQLVGLPIDTFLDPPYLKAAQSQLLDVLSATELAPPVRDTFRRLDGSTVEVVVRAVAFLDHGRPSAHLVIRDITERLAVEQAVLRVDERLHEAQRMESVGSLAGGVAHEVNNMMQVVLGFSDFLLGDTRLPPECAADVREIIRGANRAAAVTRQLLAFSRRAVHRPEVVDITAAVREAEPVVRRLLGDEQRLVVATDSELEVWVDRGQLQQVIINLALNARDAMPAGGTLTIATAMTDVKPGIVAGGGGVIPPGHYASLAVQDTGTGMDLTTLAQIFDPFFTTKPVGQGTGLGLAAAHGVLTQNHGYITVASALGEGATFTVYLPILPVAEHGTRRRDTPAAPPHVLGTGGMILVVDDEPAVRELAARILERGGFSVLLAADGTEALELVDRHGPPQLVLTDLMMPDISGAEVARRLRKRWPALPILFMSGFSAEELHWPGPPGPTSDLLQKPFTAERLVARVAETIAGLDLDAPAITQPV
ncbi:MAG: response regulator [Gemmatimonadales bacterium]